jgi:hypothetical protein
MALGAATTLRVGVDSVAAAPALAESRISVQIMIEAAKHGAYRTYTEIAGMIRQLPLIT